jgi:FkbM family methyltransferase
MKQVDCEVRLDDERSIGLVFVLGEGDDLGDQVATGVLEPSGPIRWLLSAIAPGDHVLDLGAHIGTFALPAARLGARVTAVEASPTNAELLREAARANGLEESITVIESAVSGAPGVVQFVDMGPYGTIETENLGRACGWPTVEVGARTIDSLEAAPDWVKIDIEGAECAALGAGAATLASVRGLVTESNGYMLHEHGASPERLVAILEDAGLEVFSVSGRVLAPLGTRRFQPQTTVDYVAVRGAPGLPPGWELGDPQGAEDAVATLAAELRHPVPQHRAYALAVAMGAPRSVRYRPAVRRALRELEADDNPYVVQARARLHR